MKLHNIICLLSFLGALSAQASEQIDFGILCSDKGTPIAHSNLIHYYSPKVSSYGSNCRSFVAHSVSEKNLTAEKLQKLDKERADGACKALGHLRSESMEFDLPNEEEFLLAGPMTPELSNSADVVDQYPSEKHPPVKALSYIHESSIYVISGLTCAN